MRNTLILLALSACGSSINTPEDAVANASEGQRITITGQVHTTSWDSTPPATRAAELRAHAGDLDWILEQGGEDSHQVAAPAYSDTGAHYPRTPDHYILLRTKVPDGVVQGTPKFSEGLLAQAWVLGVHITDIDPAQPMPDIGATVKVTGTFHKITWNGRDTKVAIVDDATITILDGPPPLAGPGDPCSLDQECNARLICQRDTRTCGAPPREIYWADPWHDVNGACDSDADCPLGQVCDTRYAMQSTGMYAPAYLRTTDIGRHMCRLVPGATVDSQCPRIYTTRDVAGARFVTGKEICVRVTMLSNVPATDGDTHDQTHIDEPIPYPTDDIAYNLFGVTTENGPIYKDPAQPAGAIADPAPESTVIAVGTFRYDPDHGWHEVHPVKAYFPAP